MEKEGRYIPAKGQEKIEEGVWRPGILDKYSDKVSAGASTKLLKEGESHALKLLGDKERFSGSMSARIRAGKMLAKIRNRISPETDLHNVVKSQLVHGTEIKKIDEDFVADLIKGNLPNKQILKTDGIITNLKDYPLYISAADCAPVGIYDPVNNAIGVFHSGFYGTKALLSEKGVESLRESYGSKPEDLIVVIAPSISSGYEIDHEMRQKFIEEYGEGAEQFVKTSPSNENKFLLDVSGAIKRSLIRAGVKEEHIELSRYTTDKDNDLFPSSRIEKEETGTSTADSFGFMMILKK